MFCPLAQVSGARPAANMTWYNTSKLISDEDTGRADQLTSISTKTVRKICFNNLNNSAGFGDDGRERALMQSMPSANNRNRSSLG